MPKTKTLYLEDAYQKTASAKVQLVKKSGKQTQIILNQTIFYPTGGGQPNDRGVIKSKTGTLKVTQVCFDEGKVIHTGKIGGNLKKGQKVELEIDWDLRYKHMQIHTAGHILDEAVKEIMPEHHGVKGKHGIGNKQFIKFKGFIDQAYQQDIQQTIDTIIGNDEPITTRFVTKEQLDEENIFIPFKLPKDKQLRLISIGNRPPVPDGGTQLKSTGVSWPISITDFDYDNGQTTIHYQLTPPQVSETTKKVSDDPQSDISDIPMATPTLTTLNWFTKQIDEVFQQFDRSNKDKLTVAVFLGKKGHINQLSHHIPKLPKENRSAAGKLLNQLKADITRELRSSTQTKSTDSDWLDVTAPGDSPAMGHLHPITQAISDIQHIFESIGFTRVRYPEVDWDYYVFESLNMPPDHPARDEWETFFIDTPKHKKYGQMVLTTHTSNGQVREMERVKKPPIRMLNIAKCYRRQQDVTHTAMFHQFEGLVVDKDINIQHLKGTLDYFAKKYYGPDAKSRIRPFMFRFTEPSFEVDFSCVHCSGKGCRFCKSGWHEVGGAGMVHPNVLKFGGIDPNKYTGFAFGWGIERVYTLKPGLQLDDIRPLYSKNLDFLKQF